MTNSPDPSLYRNRERQAVDHVERLLKDDRLRLDTTEGRRAVVALLRDITHEDRQVDLKRLMSEMGIFDRLLESKMPVGRRLVVTLLRNRFLLFTQTVGRIEVACLSPWKELLNGQTPTAMDRGQLEAQLSKMRGDSRAPTTFVVVSTAGFTPDARLLVEHGPRRTIVLVEPNDSGGWTVTAPAETPTLGVLFDPELDADKRKRVRDEIEKNKADLLSAGLSAERLASATQLPRELVEDELELYAMDTGLRARRLDGNVVLYRDGSSPAAAGAGGLTMPFIDRLRAIFSGKGDNEKKIRLLSERRAGLSVQRDRAYEEMSLLEKKETDLRDQFKNSASGITKRRITTQLVQLRKDADRRQQLLGMLNQQINIVGTHLHNLELVQQGQTAQLPSSEELANDAAAAEEVLAELQADSELAGSMATAGPSGMTEEEQTLYEELEREMGGGKAPVQPQAQRVAQPSVAKTPVAPEPELAESPAAPPPQRQKRPGEAEPG